MKFKNHLTLFIFVFSLIPFSGNASTEIRCNWNGLYSKHKELQISWQRTVEEDHRQFLMSNMVPVDIDESVKELDQKSKDGTLVAPHNKILQIESIDLVVESEEMIDFEYDSVNAGKRFYPHQANAPTIGRRIDASLKSFDLKSFNPETNYSPSAMNLVGQTDKQVTLFYPYAVGHGLDFHGGKSKGFYKPATAVEFDFRYKKPEDYSHNYILNVDLKSTPSTLIDGVLDAVIRFSDWETYCGKEGNNFGCAKWVDYRGKCHVTYQ